jgi:hypothetical protein
VVRGSWILTPAATFKCPSPRAIPSSSSLASGGINWSVCPPRPALRSSTSSSYAPPTRTTAGRTDLSWCACRAAAASGRGGVLEQAERVFHVDANRGQPARVAEDARMPNSVRLPNTLNAARARAAGPGRTPCPSSPAARSAAPRVARGRPRSASSRGALGAIGRRHEHRRMHVAHAARVPARHALGGGANRGGGVVHHPGAGRQHAGQRLEHGVDRGVVGQREVNALGSLQRLRLGRAAVPGATRRTTTSTDLRMRRRAEDGNVPSPGTRAAFRPG